MQPRGKEMVRALLRAVETLYILFFIMATDVFPGIQLINVSIKSSWDQIGMLFIYITVVHYFLRFQF